VVSVLPQGALFRLQSRAWNCSVSYPQDPAANLTMQSSKLLKDQSFNATPTNCPTHGTTNDRVHDKLIIQTISCTQGVSGGIWRFLRTIEVGHPRFTSRVVALISVTGSITSVLMPWVWMFHLCAASLWLGLLARSSNLYSVCSPCLSSAVTHLKKAEECCVHLTHS
jgi:hypothetical protein